MITMNAIEAYRTKLLNYKNTNSKVQQKMRLRGQRLLEIQTEHDFMTWKEIMLSLGVPLFRNPSGGPYFPRYSSFWYPMIKDIYQQKRFGVWIETSYRTNPIGKEIPTKEFAYFRKEVEKYFKKEMVQYYGA